MFKHICEHTSSYIGINVMLETPKFDARNPEAFLSSCSLLFILHNPLLLMEDYVLSTKHSTLIVRI